MSLEEQTDEFASVAAEFCQWAEGRPEDPVAEFETAHRLTARLYHLGLSLPSGIESTTGDIPSQRRSDEESQAMYERFASLPFDYYKTVDEPHDLEELEAVVPPLAQLGDDMRDIYFDLRVGLDLFERGARIDAAWTWKFGFESHWGEHAASALNALHNYRDREGAW